MQLGTSIARFASISLLATTAVAGNVLVVAPSGAPYTDIQPAIDAAHDGDIVLVKPGAYSSFAVRNIELTIVADSGALVDISGPIRIGPNQSNRTLMLQGLRSVGIETTSAFTRHGLYAHDVDGLLLVQNCQLFGKGAFDGSCTVGNGALLERCAKACFVWCQVQGGGGMNSNWGPPGKGMRIVQSSVALDHCGITGGRGGNDVAPCGDALNPYAYGDGSPGGIGLENEQSFTFGAITTIEGGRGGNGYVWPMASFCGAGGAGGLGLNWISGQQTELRGGLLAGGNYGQPSPAFGCGSHGPVGAASAGLAPNSVAVPNRYVLVEPPRREQQTAGWSFTGVPGERVDVVPFDTPVFVWQPTLDSVRFYSLRKPSPVLQVGTIPGNGHLSIGGTVGELGPGVQGVRWLAQPVFSAAGGSSYLLPPLASVRVDSSF